MNSLASILYSSSSANPKKRKNLSFQPSLKPITTKSKVGMLFRSSTPKTPLQPRTKTAHPTTTSSIFLSTNQSPQSPRCSTPLFAKQRRTRPFIACELCRQRAFGNDEDKKKTIHNGSVRRCRDRRLSSIDQLLVWII